MPFDIDRINYSLANIWDKYNCHLRQPIVYPQMITQSLLFIGLNPSYVVSGSSFEVIPGDKSTVRDFDDNYAWKGLQHYEAYLAIERARVSVRDYHTGAFFTPIKAISQRSNIHWQLVDLFAVSETKQEVAKAILGISGSTEADINMGGFAQDQVELIFGLIKESDPRAIVVINALASSIFKWWCTEKQIPLEWDDEVGYDAITLQAHSVPVFFSGMLSGQRALDRHSLRRLEWHVQRAVGRSVGASKYRNECVELPLCPCRSNPSPPCSIASPICWMRRVRVR